MSTIQTNLQGLLQKKVSRKEFLGIVGLTALSIFGFGTIFQLLTGKSLGDRQVLHDYGAASYGGSRKTASGARL